MTETPLGAAEQATPLDLSEVEAQDDEARLRSLEDLHAHLEAELERDDPTTGSDPRR